MGKGEDFERSMCKLLGEWWTDKERSDIFWRTAGSGGRATSRRKRNVRTEAGYGDFKAEAEIGKPFENFFVGEFKRGYGANAELLLIVDSKRSNPEILIWLKKLIKELKFSGRKEFFLILKRDRKKELIIFRTSFFSKMEDTLGVWDNHNILDVNIKRLQEKFTIVRLSDFLAWCPASEMKAIINMYK